jgi:chemotaxis protein CheD
MEKEIEYKTKFILPGELFFSSKPYKISTVLGSCISVVLYNIKYCFGGMNHYVLDFALNKNSFVDLKYGEFSIPILISKMKKQDNNLKNCVAKIFGGGNVVNSITNVNIGLNNIKIAKKILSDYNIPIIKEYVNNDFGLKVHYFNFNNKVLVSKIRKINSEL